MRRRSVTRHVQVDQVQTGHFRQGKGYYAWRPNGTPDWLLIYTIAGLGRIGLSTGGEIVAEPGDAVLLRPGALHDYGVEPTRQRWELLWAHFHPRAAWHAWLSSWPQAGPGVLRLRLTDAEIRRRVRARFADADRLCNSTALRHAETFSMNALEEVLLWCDLQNPKGSPMDGRVRAATDYLDRNLKQKVTIDALAEHCGLSASRLAHLFRAQVGYTPQQFLEVQRMNRAAQLLEMTSQSIKEIAAEVGFDNPFYFTLRFKKKTGMSPRAYRRRG